MEKASKHRKQLTGQQAIALALSRGKTTSQEKIHKDIWRQILLETEVRSILNLSTVRPVSKILYDDTFWKEKFVRDFPDLVEIVGENLPGWITSGDMNASQEFKDVPWRRYYNVIRYILKKIIERIIEISTQDQDEFSRVYDTGRHPFMIKGTMSQANMFFVDVILYERSQNDGSYFVWEKGDVLGKDTYSIWKFCQDFLLTYYPDSNGDELNQFYKPLENINFIRSWLRMEIYLSMYASDRTYFLREEYIKSFLHWITDAKNVQDTFWTKDLSNYFEYKYQKLLDWINDPDRPYYGGPPETAVELMLKASRTLDREFNFFVARHFKQSNFDVLVSKGRTGFRNEHGVLLIGNFCDVCKIDAKFVCGGCEKISYCGEQCAKWSWSNSHKFHCK